MMAIPFHPIVWRWFSERFSKPTAPQEEGWKYISEGRDTLIAAPTGSGKTLAAFLWSIDRLICRAVEKRLEDKVNVVYVSPLKALGNDIEKNLQEPLAGILSLAEAQGIELPSIRAAVRSGDTPSRERELMIRRPPHILITTPESLFILLTAGRSRHILKQAESVIVDEIHAVAGDKRGAHLALSLERLDALVGKPLQRIGLSATQKPIGEIARLLVGAGRIGRDGGPDCAIVDVGHQRDLDLSIEVPDQELGPIVKHEIWAEIYERIVNRVKAHRTTLVFVNTRRLVERVSHQLSARLGEAKVGAHHGSLSRNSRLEVEQGLKSGTLPVVVATASLELGIDIGFVDLVCHIGAPRTVATFLQRVGRSGHWLGATPKGILYPLTRDELVQCAAVVRAVRAGELDHVTIPKKPLDVLAQQMVATVASADDGMTVEELWELVRSAYPYRELSRIEFEQVLEMLSEGIARRRGRRSAYLHYDRVHERLRARRGARLVAITNGGAIPDTADYDVVKVPDEIFVGKVNEDFAIESLAGDIFLLGNSSWRIRRVASGKVWVEDAQGLPPSIPFWLGEAPGRSPELCAAVSDLRSQVASRLGDRAVALLWLMEECKISQAGAEQIFSYIRETLALLGCVPTLDCVVAERFFDEAGGMQLVLHAPFGSRINRAWGLALRKRICATFDRELQAAATDDGIVISLSEQHSFPCEDALGLVRLSTMESDLTQAALASPMFVNRWRWNANRALALLRFSGGKKVPMAIQRMRAEDLLASVFPEQVMCQDNRVGPVELPDHPLVNETIRDCLHEAMDLNGLKAILQKIENREIRTVAVESPAPSPMAHEILNANPYAFLDDAPLEERRARAVSLRRMDLELAVGMGALSSQAIETVREQAWPKMRDAEDLHDFLLGVSLLPLDEAREWAQQAQELIQAGRATVISWPLHGERREAYVAAEHLSLISFLFPDFEMNPEIKPLAGPKTAALSSEEVLRSVVQGWAEVLGPVTASSLAQRLFLPPTKIAQALLALEAGGVVLRGRFTRGRESEAEIEWCERGLLSRIHRLTLNSLRKEIEPVTAADFMKFLFSWHHLDPKTQLRGRDGILEVAGQLQGLELPAPAWESHILPSRIAEYDPADLESLCLAGAVAWGRVRSDDPFFDDAGEKPGSSADRAGAGRRRKRRATFTRLAPISFLLRNEMENFLVGTQDRPWDSRTVSVSASAVARYLEENGASFLADVARGTGLLKSQAEEALWELVARGFVTGDGIAGLRVLLTPEVKRRGRRRRLRLLAGGRAPERLMPVGRWSLWRSQSRPSESHREGRDEFLARQLLRRYGVVLRELLAREMGMPPWRTLLQIYRRLEARGEIRGGRFVNGFVGEQYALPEALDLLRLLRRTHSEAKTLLVSSADPLNLVGILTPGQRVSPYSNQFIVYTGGVPVEIGPLGGVRSRIQEAAADLGDSVP